MNDGRERVPWNQEIWDRIDQAVHYECKRAKVAAKFLPMYGPIAPSAFTVPSDTVQPLQTVLAVDEAATTRIVEIMVPFTLTKQQVAEEGRLMTGVTLATRAANILSQAEDILIFQGDTARDTDPLFIDRRGSPRKVQIKSGNAGIGLLNFPDQPGANKGIQTLSVEGVKIIDKDGIETVRWRENTFTGVSAAYSRLQSGEGLSQAHYGPYVLVFHHVPYADTFAPLENTLILTADRIKPLVTNATDGKQHFYGTGTLGRTSLKGLFLSFGGNTVDLVMAQDAKVAVLQEDPEGNYVFRVFERFAVREKDVSSVVSLDFIVTNTIDNRAPPEKTVSQGEGGAGGA